MVILYNQILIALLVFQDALFVNKQPITAHNAIQTLLHFIMICAAILIAQMAFMNPLNRIILVRHAISFVLNATDIHNPVHNVYQNISILRTNAIKFVLNSSIFKIK